LHFSDLSICRTNFFVGTRWNKTGGDAVLRITPQRSRETLATNGKYVGWEAVQFCVYAVALGSLVPWVA
jgi:hypothetical protein